ncbi:MAG: hypothetical protein VW851_06160 [Cryomorphaceae bacterium]
MRTLVITAFLLLSLNASAQWGHKPPPPNPPPPVPLDGGLVALIGAGAALGYKKYKEKNQE